MRILKLTKETQNNILENLLKRSPNSYGEFESRVNDIIQNVREKRDEAIFEYTLKFDVHHRSGQYPRDGRRDQRSL